MGTNNQKSKAFDGTNYIRETGAVSISVPFLIVHDRCTSIVKKVGGDEQFAASILIQVLT